MREENRIVYIDMDDVLADCVPTLLEAYNRMYDSDIRLEDITEWRLPKDMARIFKYPDFFYNLRPIPGAIEGVRRIASIHNFEGNLYRPIIATSCGNILDVREQKRRWIQQYLPMFADSIVFTQDKSSLKGLVMIDDAPQHLEGFSKITICMDRPWNQHVQCNRRVFNQDWNEILRLFGDDITNELR